MSMPQPPQAPTMPQADPSMLPEQLPGGVGDAAKNASDTAAQMQNMSCPSFNPGMPGADLAESMTNNLDVLNNAAQQIKNPAVQQLSDAQTA